MQTSSPARAGRGMRRGDHPVHGGAIIVPSPRRARIGVPAMVPGSAGDGREPSASGGMFWREPHQPQPLNHQACRFSRDRRRDGLGAPGRAWGSSLPPELSAPRIETGPPDRIGNTPRAAQHGLGAESAARLPGDPAARRLRVGPRNITGRRQPWQRRTALRLRWSTSTCSRCTMRCRTSSRSSPSSVSTSRARPPAGEDSSAAPRARRP